jgi:hypothetical protein
VGCDLPLDQKRPRVYDLEGVLGPSVINFVEHHVSTLLAWDVLVFFHRNPDEAIECEVLASRLGRRVDEVGPEVDRLCDGEILDCADGAIRFAPTPEMGAQVDEFVDACQDRGRRLALIALVLHRLSRTAEPHV